jgi:hypothetical protein
LQRLRSEILKAVHKLHQANKKNFWQDWFKEFICSAILLNNYGLATEHDIRFAERHSMQVKSLDFCRLGLILLMHCFTELLLKSQAT